jgi:two-component sensor histidine kinase
MIYFRHRVEALLSSGVPVRDSYRGLFAPVALIGLIHIIGGTAVLFAPQAAYVSQLSGPMMLLPRSIAIAVGLIVIGLMAVAARLLKMSEQMRVALIAPQQILLLIQFVGVSVAAWQGAYPDGYVPVPGNWRASFWFILGDQAALLVLCLSPTFEFVTLKAFRLPTPAQYEAKLAKKNAAAAALRQERDELELRVKERTERLHMLNAELHHRFKNLLSVVSAMARQSGLDQTFSNVFDQRLRGLAATLDLLTEKHWHGVRIRELLKAQLGIFEDTLEVHVSGPYFMLKPSAVQPLGMAFHELATNALKHNPRGKQAISWEVLPDEAEPRLRFIWSETRNSESLPPPAKAAHSGRKLLERIVPQAFSGTGTLTVTAARVNWVLVAPLSMVGDVIDGAPVEESGEVFSLN